MKRWLSRTCFLLIFSLGFVACAGRVPTAKTAQRVATSYFNKYGHKYRETAFAKGHIDRVSINGIEEVSYKIVYVDTLLKMKSGDTTRTLVKMENHFPGGWRVLSWEVLETQ